METKTKDYWMFWSQKVALRGTGESDPPPPPPPPMIPNGDE
jgi:hypothetical protein